MYMYLVIREVHQNNPDNDVVLAYADDIAQTATSIEKLQERMTDGTRLSTDTISS